MLQRYVGLIGNRSGCINLPSPRPSPPGPIICLYVVGGSQSHHYRFFLFLKSLYTLCQTHVIATFIKVYNKFNDYLGVYVPV